MSCYTGVHIWRPVLLAFQPTRAAHQDILLLGVFGTLQCSLAPAFLIQQVLGLGKLCLKNGQEKVELQTASEQLVTPTHQPTHCQCPERVQ